MAICHILEHPTAGQQEMARVAQGLRGTGPVPPDGARLVLSGPTEPGWRVIAVWDSREDLDRFFAERLRTAYQHAGLSLDDVRLTTFEVQNLMAGDLVGAPQPA